jgi:uncharacterized protein YndB with AHSA1/START domain
MRQTEAFAASEDDRSVVITRTFDAPVHLVFEACSRPEHVKRWFGPVGWPLTLCEMDFRVGGRYRFAMTGPDGVQGTPFSGTYLEIVPDRRIVYDNAFELPGAETMVMHFDFTEENGRTTLTLNTLFASLAMKATHVGAGFVQGTGSGLSQLEELVAELVAKAR